MRTRHQPGYEQIFDSEHQRGDVSVSAIGENEALYVVEQAWQEPGLYGRIICRFRLRRLAGETVPFSSEADGRVGPSEHVGTYVQRLVRSSMVVQRVKTWHRNLCQVCGERIDLVAGAYAEGAHIRPLGAPHDGPDQESNVLCLCPNDHVRFDYGAIVIEDDWTIRHAQTGASLGTLATVPQHHISQAHVAYHRNRFGVLGHEKSEQP
jgi:putative restriction endonuclease